MPQPVTPAAFTTPGDDDGIDPYEEPLDGVYDARVYPPGYSIQPAPTPASFMSPGDDDGMDPYEEPLDNMYAVATALEAPENEYEALCRFSVEVGASNIVYRA